jgi:hypothetical protein
MLRKGVFALAAILLLTLCCLSVSASSHLSEDPPLTPASAGVLAAKGDSILKKLGLKALGWAVSAVIGLLKEKPTDIIKQKLDAIAKQVKQLETRMDSIDEQLSQISLQQFLIPANQQKSIITSLHEKMIFFVTTAPRLQKAQWEANLKDLKDSIDREALKACQELKDLLIGNSATQSLYGAMQTYLVESDNTIVQEYVKMRQLGMLYWTTFQQASDLFVFLSEGETNLYYVEQSQLMLRFVNFTDEQLTGRFMNDSVASLVRDMFASSPENATIDFTNMYSVDSAYRPVPVQSVPTYRALQVDGRRLSEDCLLDSCLKFYRYDDARNGLISPYLNADGSMYLRPAACGESVRLSWGHFQCITDGQGFIVPFHMYRVKGETVILRFNNEKGQYYKEQDMWYYFCMMHYTDGLHNDWRQDLKSFDSIPQAKREHLCVWSMVRP